MECGLLVSVRGLTVGFLKNMITVQYVICDNAFECHCKKLSAISDPPIHVQPSAGVSAKRWSNKSTTVHAIFKFRINILIYP